MRGFNRLANAEELLRGNLRLFWPAMLILLVSGGLLVVSEPGRDLLNPMFQIKMATLVGGIVFVAASKNRLEAAGFDGLEFKLNNRAKKVIAISIAFIFTSIIGLGRWIAYFDAGTS